jgi:hypothetical protein
MNAAGKLQSLITLRHAMKKTLVLIVSSVALGLATVASAQTYTYSFTGTSSTGVYPPDFIDGSTLTISGGTITTYDFTAIGFGNFGTPATTTLVSETVASYGPAGWSGELDLGYYYIDMEVTGDSFTSLDLGASIQGVWTSVPDGANTFALLGAVALGLAAGRPWLRRQS